MPRDLAAALARWKRVPSIYRRAIYDVVRIEDHLSVHAGGLDETNPFVQGLRTALVVLAYAAGDRLSGMQKPDAKVNSGGGSA